MCFLKSFCKHRTYIFKYRLRTYLANWYYLCLYAEVLPRKKSSWENKILCLDDMVLLFSLSTFKSMHAGAGRRTFSAEIPLTLFLFYVYKSAGPTEHMETVGICPFGGHITPTNYLGLSLLNLKIIRWVWFKVTGSQLMESSLERTFKRSTNSILLHSGLNPA